MSCTHQLTIIGQMSANVQGREKREMELFDLLPRRAIAKRKGSEPHLSIERLGQNQSQTSVSLRGYDGCG